MGAEHRDKYSQASREEEDRVHPEDMCSISFRVCGGPEYGFCVLMETKIKKPEQSENGGKCWNVEESVRWGTIHKRAG